MFLPEKTIARLDLKARITEAKTKADLDTVIAELGLDNFNRVYASFDAPDWKEVTGRILRLTGQTTPGTVKEVDTQK